MTFRWIMTMMLQGCCAALYGSELRFRNDTYKSPCAAVPQRLKAVQVTQPKTLYAACVFKALKYFKLLKNQHVIKDFTLPADFWVTRTSL